MSTDDVRCITFGVLNGAADYITDHGWVQDEYKGAGGALCAVGAINAARGCDVESLHGLAEAAEALGVLNDLRSYGGPGRKIERWNDAPDRTQAEVVTRLRAAAHIVRHDLEAPVLNEWAG